MKMITSVLVILFGTIVLFGCSIKDERNQLFICKGEWVEFKVPVPVTIDLYIGDKSTEISGRKYKICEDKKTLLEFSTECNPTVKNRDVYSFSWGELKLIGYKLDWIDLEKKMRKPYERTTEVYQCSPVENRNK
jgi:hypothetical protein